MDEDDHALQHIANLGEIRRVPCVSLGVNIFQGDLAAGLPVIRDEALGLVPRTAEIQTEHRHRYVIEAPAQLTREQWIAEYSPKTIPSSEATPALPDRLLESAKERAKWKQ